MYRLNRGSVRKALAALVVLILSTFGLAGMANAEPTPTPNPNLSYGNIDKDAKGSITVHKHLHQDTDEPVIGDPADPANPQIPSDPVAGVTFTIHKLTYDDASEIDLTDPDSWDGLKDLTPGTGDCAAPNGYAYTGPGTTAVTDSDGIAKFNDLSLGVYLVCETDAPDHVVERAMPFIVVIPFPHENGWLYDVHAYPKNSIADKPTKTIEEQEGLVAGSPVSFPVTVKVPKLASDESYESFTVWDELDPRLTPTGATVSPEGYGTPAINGQRITVTFTAAEFKALAGQTITVTFNATVNEDIGAGEIYNTAITNINGNDFESNTVKTNWGDLVVLKKADGTDATLAGAKFDLYAATPPYGASCEDAVKTGDPIATGLETDSDGKVRVSALFVSDSVNAPINATFRCYVLVETQAPAGYVTPTGTDAEFPVAVTIGQTDGVDITIDNTQQDVPELPLTGSSGALIMLIIGVSLVGGALMLIVLSRRKTAQANL